MEPHLSLAIKVLNLIELKNIGFKLALNRVAEQIKIRDERTIIKTGLLIRNILYRKNFIDRVIDLVITPASQGSLSISNLSFLRIFVFETLFHLKNIEEVVNLAKIGRSILGWKRFMPIEEALGGVLKIDKRKVLSGLVEYKKIAIKTFYPEWFVRYCTNLLGRSKTLNLLRYSKPKFTYLRINTFKKDEVKILRELSKSGIDLIKVADIPYLYRAVHEKKEITKLEAYKNGFFSFPNITSCFAVVLGEPRPDFLVYDVGTSSVMKTIYLAQLMGKIGKIFSINSSKRRVDMLRIEAEKTGFRNIEPCLGKTKDSLPYKEKADLILLGPDCSGTGLFWRNPSLKWSVNFAKIKVAADAQWRKLNTLANYVKNGGNIVYWTNSITIEENEMIIERFLKLHPEFSLRETIPRLGETALRGQKFCQRLYPYIHEADGSFFAKLQYF